MDNKYQLINDLINLGKSREAIIKFKKIKKENTVGYWLTKGKIEQKSQNWGGAINAFNKVLEIEAGNMEAKNNIGLIQNIITFWNPEMFNP